MSKLSRESNGRSEPEPLLFGITDFATAMRMSRASVYRLLASQGGPRTIKIGRRRFVPLTAANDWISQQIADQSRGKP